MSLLTLPAIVFADGDVSPSHELDVLRGIAVNERATYADLCNILSIQRGEFAKFETAVERCQNLTGQGIYDFSKIADIFSETVKTGVVAKSAINAHGLDRSLMYFVTRLEWYAVQNAEALQILPPKSKPAQGMSGEELLAVLEKSYAIAGERKRWGEPRNAYEEFGVATYEELEKAYAEATDLKTEK